MGRMAPAPFDSVFRVADACGGGLVSWELESSSFTVVVLGTYVTSSSGGSVPGSNVLIGAT